jgi:hypothetical protein
MKNFIIAGLVFDTQIDVNLVFDPSPQYKNNPAINISLFDNVEIIFFCSL